MILKEKICDLLRKQPGLSDRQIANCLHGKDAPQQPINIACRDLEKRGLVTRQKREDGVIGNYLTESGPPPPPRSRDSKEKGQTEDGVKRAVEAWLAAKGWKVKVAWGGSRGVDITATKENQPTWIIEVKGEGAHDQAQGNYFIAILGQILQRMEDVDAIYSIALPDLPRFRGLWDRLPAGAKLCTGITAIFVSSDGTVTELLSAPPDAEAVRNEADKARRYLIGLLGMIDGKRVGAEEKLPERVERLVKEAKIPRLVASCMRLLLTFRNVVVYKESEPTAFEVTAWQAARDSVRYWARGQQYGEKIPGV